jgi:hypothetical protein
VQLVPHRVCGFRGAVTGKTQPHVQRLLDVNSMFQATVQHAISGTQTCSQLFVYASGMMYPTVQHIHAALNGPQQLLVLIPSQCADAQRRRRCTDRA